MGIPTALRAREPQAAARSYTLILPVCAVAVAAWTVLDWHALSGLAGAASWAGVALLAAAAAVFRFAPADWLDRVGAGALAALAGVLLTCLLRVLTEDTSVAAHAFLTFPVLWAASHLERGGVVLVTAAALVGDAATVLLLLPLDVALTDLVFSGAVLVVVAVLLWRAASVQARLVSALQEQAEVDALTGLVNRRVFDEALHESVGIAGAALVLLDVDAFKTINDSHGHPVGDDVLVHLAGILRCHVRAEDAVVSRLGGDELAVLLPGSPADAAARRAEELLQTVRSTPLPLPDGTLLSLSVSVGVAHVPPGRGDLRALYSAADAALYEAKRAGRGRVTVAA